MPVVSLDKRGSFPLPPQKRSRTSLMADIVEFRRHVRGVLKGGSAEELLREGQDFRAKKIVGVPAR